METSVGGMVILTVLIACYAGATPANTSPSSLTTGEGTKNTTMPTPDLLQSTEPTGTTENITETTEHTNTTTITPIATTTPGNSSTTSAAGSGCTPQDHTAAIVLGILFVIALLACVCLIVVGLRKRRGGSSIGG